MMVLCVYGQDNDAGSRDKRPAFSIPWFFNALSSVRK